ncbi:MAG: TSUP family transporter [Brevinema sp.]
MSITALLLGFVIFATHFLSALTGFGCTILAMPFVIPILGIGIAKPLLLTLGTAQPLMLVVHKYRYTRWDILKTILICAGAGLPLGFILYAYLPQNILLIALGCVMVIAGILGIARLQGLSFEKIPQWFLYLITFLGGIIQGAFVSGGPLIVIYASLVLKDKNEFRATLSVLWLILNGIIIIQSLITNQFTFEVGRYILISAPILVAAVLLGHVGANKVSKRFFDYILNSVLVLGGIVTVVNRFLLYIAK